MTTPEARALAGSARWQRRADRLARCAWPVLLASVAIALVGGLVVAAWNPDTGDPQPSAEACENPPCFGGGGPPGANDLPVVRPVLGYGLAVVLGLPSLLAGGWDLLRGRRAGAGRRVLAFAGPVLVVAGTELIPHLVSPCLPAELGAGRPPPVCERTEEHGLDVAGRWHALHHALVGAAPMAALYWLALRRWRPELIRRRGA